MPALYFVIIFVARTAGRCSAAARKGARAAPWQQRAYARRAVIREARIETRYQRGMARACCQTQAAPCCSVVEMPRGFAVDALIEARVYCALLRAMYGDDYAMISAVRVAHVVG